MSHPSFLVQLQLIVATCSRGLKVAKYYSHLVPNKFLSWIFCLLIQNHSTLFSTLFVPWMDYASNGLSWSLASGWFSQWEALGGETSWESIPCLSLPARPRLAVVVFYYRAQFLQVILYHCPLGSRIGKVVASSWVLYYAWPFLLILATPLLIVPSFNFLQLSLLSILLLGPWLRQSLCLLCRETINSKTLLSSVFNPWPKF